MNVSIGFATIFGLGTPASSSCYGLREFVSTLAQEYSAKVNNFYAYDSVSAGQIDSETHEADVLIGLGHSHGGAAWKWLADRLAVSQSLNRRMRLVLCFDPAPEFFHFGQVFPWQSADQSLSNRWNMQMLTVDQAICFFQRNEMILPGVGVCGVPFVPDPYRPDFVLDQRQSLDPQLDPPWEGKVININVSKLGVHHCSMLENTQILNLVKTYIANSIRRLLS